MSAWGVSVTSSHDVILGYHLPAGCQPANFLRNCAIDGNNHTLNSAAVNQAMMEVLVNLPG